MTPVWVKPLALGLLGGLLLGLALARGKPVDPVVIVRVDSVLAESPAVARQLDSLERVAAVATRDAITSKRQADRLKRVADSLSSKWRQLPDTSATEVVEKDTIISTTSAAYDTLTAAYTVLDRAFAQAMIANQSLMAEARLAQTRITTLERTLTEAQLALKQTRKPSRFGLGCAGGYAVAVSGGVAHAGPGLSCGVTVRLR